MRSSRSIAAGESFMKSEIIVGALAACGLGLLPLPAVAQGVPGSAITAATSARYGDYLADGSGRTLYLYTGDYQGVGDYDAKSICADACAQAWPPFVARTTPKAGDKVDASAIATMYRLDGRMQVTYHGWPLYYFGQDDKSGATNGQAQHDGKGEWYLIAPDGTAIGK
jgi:predicted lipoprotein with Yx(FWY)xxD motif